MTRQLSTASKKKTITAYQEFIHSQFLFHKIKNKIDHIFYQSRLAPATVLHRDIRNLDMLITRIVLKAEKRCCPRYPRYSWSPTLAAASRVVKYWSLVIKMQEHNMDLSQQIRQVKSELPDAFQQTIEEP